MNISDILQRYNVPFLTEGHHHCRPGWLQLDCPFCGSGGSKFHLGIHSSIGSVSCWRCGRHGLLDTLIQTTGRPAAEIRDLLRSVQFERTKQKEHTGKLVIPNGVRPLNKQHKRYLRGRGFDPEEIATVWGVQGITYGLQFSWRLFIPIHHNREMVSWTTRAITNIEMRYLSASSKEEAIPHKRILYGADYCTHSCVVVEGPTDAWRIGPGAVALCGTGYSQQQVMAIAQYQVRVICFDRSTAAHRRALSLCNAVRVLPGITIQGELHANDPAEASDWEIESLREAALLPPRDEARAMAYQPAETVSTQQAQIPG